MLTIQSVHGLLTLTKLLIHFIAEAFRIMFYIFCVYLDMLHCMYELRLILDMLHCMSELRLILATFSMNTLKSVKLSPVFFSLYCCSTCSSKVALDQVLFLAGLHTT